MKNTITFLLLFQLFQATAQQGFIKAFNFGYPTAVTFNTMILDEDELIVCGYIKDSIPPYQQGIFISKMDTLGQILEFKSYFALQELSYVPGAHPGKVIKLEDGSGYLFVGNILQGSDGFIIKFDLSGNEVWTQILVDNTSLQGYYHQLVETEDGFLIGGRKQLSGGLGDVFLIKTDKQGNKLWENLYGVTNKDENINSLLKINENEFVLGGHFGGGTGGWQQAHIQLQIRAVDSLGNEKWLWENNPPFDEWSVEDLGCYGLQKDGDNWVYATTRGEFQPNTGNPPSSWRQTKFVVRDSNFNLVIEKTYDDVDGQINGFNNMIQLEDGDWLGLGINTEWEDMPGGEGQAYGWMTRISNGQDGNTTLGDTLWSRLYLTFPDSNFESGQYIHSAVELPSGNIISAGYFTGFGIYPDHGLLIKVNQHGCLDWDNCTSTNFPNISLTSNPAYQPDLKVFPNPTQHQLHILSDEVPVWDKLEALDITGRVLKTVFNNNELTLEGLPSGVYVLRLWKDGQYWVRRVLKQ